MGNYTTHYNLFMPSIGEQGWGELVNNNFSIIDSTMKGLDTRVGTLDTRVGTLDTRVGTLKTDADAVEERVTALEAGNFETINCSTVIATNGFSGRLYVDSEYTTIEEEQDYLFSTLSNQSVSSSNAATAKLTVASNFVKNTTFPLKVSPGVYVPDESLIKGDYEAIKSSFFPRLATYSVNASSGRGTAVIYVDDVEVHRRWVNGSSFSWTYDLNAGQTTYMAFSVEGGTTYLSINLPECKIYIKTI